MSNPDIRWVQRFNNFSRAFSQLKDAEALSRTRPLSALEQQGIIQGFEYTHELAWSTLKDFLENRGAGNLFGSRDTSREAFKSGLLINGETWMDMIQSRNLTSHTYDESSAARIVSVILDSYVSEFQDFQNRMEAFKREETV